MLRRDRFELAGTSLRDAAILSVIASANQQIVQVIEANGADEEDEVSDD